MSELWATPRVVERLDECFFYHAMDLPGFGLVRGQWDLRGRFDDYIGSINLAGRSVLDIGTATGFLSFEAEKRGASRVVSFDMSDPRQQIFLPFANTLYSRDPEAWARQYGAEIEQWRNAYWLSHRALSSKAQVYYGSVYDLPEALGRFDVSIVGSVVEHLPDQITALASIARRTAHTIVMVSPILDTDEPIAQFAGSAARPQDDFTWWIYSKGVYREVFGMLGFRIERITRGKYWYMYGDRWEERSTLVAVRTS